MVLLVNHPQIKFQLWLSIPDSPRLLVFLVAWEYNRLPTGSAAKRLIEFELTLLLLPGVCIVAVPVIPKVTLEEAGKVIDAQCLSRNVMFDDLINSAYAAYNRPDLEVLKIQQYLKEFIFPIIGAEFDCFAAGWFSARGNFCSLFSALHPQYVTHVISMLGWAICLPVEQVGDVRLDYPLGLGRLTAMSNTRPNMERQEPVISCISLSRRTGYERPHRGRL